MSLCWRGIDPLDSFHDQMVTIQQNECRASERTNFLLFFHSQIARGKEAFGIWKIKRPKKYLNQSCLDSVYNVWLPQVQVSSWLKGHLSRLDPVNHRSISGFSGSVLKSKEDVLSLSCHGVKDSMAPKFDKTFVLRHRYWFPTDAFRCVISDCTNKT